MATKDHPDEVMQGVKSWTTKKGWQVFEIHYTADPDKRSEEWKQAAMDSMPDLQSYNREFEIDWKSTSGLAFYQAFYKKYAEDKSYYVRAQDIPDGPIIYRGFDFGFRKPACVWAWQDSDGKLRVLREFTPENIDTYEFREAVRYLSGEIAINDKTFDNKPRALEWLELVHPEGPWFKRGTKFLDFCGVEAKHVNSVVGDHGEMNDFEIMCAGGVDLYIVNQRVSSGTYIIRQLMKEQEDGSPAILIDPSCTTLVAGLAGGLTFGEGTKATPLDDAVAPDPVYSHIHDGLRYLVCGIINVADVKSVRNKAFAKRETEPKPSQRKEPPRYGPSENWEDLPFYVTIDEDV